MELRLSLSGETPPPDVAARFTGVGLIRSEYIFRRREEFVTVPSCQDMITEYIARVASIFSGRPVWYRTSELTTTEANTLRGIDRIFIEADPMKGRRGIRRALEAPDGLRTELKVVAEVARDHPNLHLIFPFVRDADDLAVGAELLSEVNWPNQFGSMIEIPSALLDLGRMQAVGATKFLLGLNDLTALLTGTTREGPDMKLHSSVWAAVRKVREELTSADWGIGGNLPSPVLDRAREEGVPFATVHYSQLDNLLGLERTHLPEYFYVYLTKVKTRSQISAAELGKFMRDFNISIS